MNTDNFTIDSADIELAQNICKIINNSDIRNRAVANALAGRIAAKYFDSEVYNVDTESGLHNIGMVLQDIDISDIYINNSYIDVRLFFSEDEMSVPAFNIDNKLLPTAYMFIKITPDLAGASVIGFKNPENINKEKIIDGYYKVEEDELESFYDIEPILSYTEDSNVVNDSSIYEYLDNTIDDKIAFYSSLIKSKEARLKLARAAKAQVIFNFVSINEQDFNRNNDEAENSENLDILDTEDLVLSDIIEPNSDIANNENLDIEIDNSESLSESAPKDSENVNSEEGEEENSDTVINVDELTEADLELSVEDNEQNIQSTSVDNQDSKTTKTEDTENLTLGGFDYSTLTSPSLNEIENDEHAINQQKQIETLFENRENDDENISTEEDEQEDSPGLKVYKKNPSGNKIATKPLVILALLIVAGASLYAGYNKFLTPTPASEDLVNTTPSSQGNNDATTEDAMPIETVDAKNVPDNKNEAVATSATIPAIEQNLDASILVSNLKVDWEVPAGYASNTSAKRYLIKLGKIIQLNLKTELLLLSKPPITNKIGVEIKYNTNTRKFEATGVTISSGEKSVDDLILRTVNKALGMNLSINTDSFAKLQGNPVLIIHL